MKRILFSAALAFTLLSCGDSANNGGATDSTNMTNSGSNNAMGTDTLSGSGSGTTNPGSSTGAGTGTGAGTSGSSTGTTGSGTSGSGSGSGTSGGTHRDTTRH